MTLEKQTITVYGRPSCPMVPPVLHALDVAEAPYTYIDIRQDPEGSVRVREINHGNESVPTLVFPDGTTLTEPGLSALRKKLAEFGHKDEALEGIVAQVGFKLRNPVILITVLVASAMLVYMVFGR